jgi:hypothetical protein
MSKDVVANMSKSKSDLVERLNFSRISSVDLSRLFRRRLGEIVAYFPLAGLNRPRFLRFGFYRAAFSKFFDC